MDEEEGIQTGSGNTESQIASGDTTNSPNADPLEPTIGNNSQQPHQLSSAQLYRRQQLMQQYGAGIAGLGSLAGQYNSIYNRGRFLQTSAPSPENDSFGRPSYNLGTFAAATAGIRPKGASAGDIAAGAGTGAAIGTEILPGWGTAVGAVVGAAGSAIAGFVNKSAMEHKKTLAMNSLKASNMLYNGAAQQFNNQQMAHDSYNYYNDPQKRESNIDTYNQTS